MRRLVALDAGMGQGFVDALLRAWDRGDAVFPVDPRLPGPALKRMLNRAGVGKPVEDDDALVIATSGATGEPRSVVLTHDALLASAHAINASMEVDPSFDRWLACLPMSHIAGISVVIRAVLTDTPVTVHPRFDVEEVTAAARSGATLTALGPTALRELDPSIFRRVIVGGGAPRPDTSSNVVYTYGLTETAGGVVHDGKPLKEVELRVVDEEIWVSSPTLLRAYRDGTDPKTDDGWLPTGDRGHLDPDTGELTFLGRGTDVIITDGQAVWPEGVEATLAHHPDVADVAIMGFPDRECGQRVVAIVVPRDPATPPSLDELQNWVVELLPGAAAPRELRYAAALPRSPVGELKRRGLKNAR